jgi:L,D-transpeptidase catalytic domain
VFGQGGPVVQTVKTGVVVALLLAVCYGAFVALNAPDPELPPELRDWVEESEGDSLVSVDVGTPNVPDIATGFPTSSDLSGLPGLDLPKVEMNPQPLVPNTENKLASGTSNASIPSNPNVFGLTNHPSDQSSIKNADGPSISLPNGNAVNAASPDIRDDSLVGAMADATNGGTTTYTSKNNAPNAEFPSIPLISDSKDAASPGASSGSNTLPLLNAETNSAKAATAPDAENKQALPPFKVAREDALKKANEEKLREALVQLTLYYNDPELTHAEREDLLAILDALSREVIFSQRHIALPAHVTLPSETVATIAEKYRITPELLANINQLGKSQALVQGQKLKVIQGPFRGEVNLTENELTLFAGDMYACRFPFSAGQDPAPKPGTFEVVDKRRDRTYYGVGGKVIAADNPQNPYGKFWIDLGQNYSIHGTAEMTTVDLSNAGCMSLAPIDASDVFTMLTKGSRIEVR